MGILVLVAIGLGLGLHALHQKAEEARAREHAVDAQIARIDQERQSYEALMRQPDNAQLLTQAAALNRLFDQKAFSWTLAMENLETVLPGGVQVASIEPTPTKDGHITLHLRVVGPHDRSVDLLRNLEHSRRFFQPRIVGETSESSNNPNQRLEPVSASNRFTFDLQVEYNPPAPDESIAAADSKKAPANQDAAKTGGDPQGQAQNRGPEYAQQHVRRPYTGPNQPTSGGPQ